MTIALAELVALRKGLSYASKHFDAQGVALLSLGCIDQHANFRIEGVKWYAGPFKPQHELTPGDVVVAMTDLTQNGHVLGQPLRIPAFTDRKMIGSLHLARVDIQDTSRLDPTYLFYRLRAHDYRWWVSGAATGTTVRMLRTKDVLDFRLDLPTLAEQRAIAGVLGALDDKIELNRRMNEALSALARTLYRRLENEVASEASIYEYAQVAYGAPFASAQFNSRREGMPLIRIRDLGTFAPEVWTTERLPRETVIEPGDLVVGMDGEFRAQIWLGDRAVLNQRVCSFRPKSRVPLSFLWQAVRADLAFYEQAKTGTTVIHLGKSDIDRFTTPAPSAEQLDAFGRQAEPLVAKLVANAQESRVLGELRDALLPKLISGELRVRDAKKVAEPEL